MRNVKTPKNTSLQALGLVLSGALQSDLPLIAQSRWVGGLRLLGPTGGPLCRHRDQRHLSQGVAQRGTDKPQPVQNHRFQHLPRADGVQRMSRQKLVRELHQPHLIH